MLAVWRCAFLLSLSALAVYGKQAINVEDKEFWYYEGTTSLKLALGQSRNLNKAHNVIIFIGDGMGLPTVTAARIFKEQQNGNTAGGEEGYLAWDTFPYTGLTKTYNVDRQVPDSAGTATAMFTGVKTNYYVVGLDATSTFSQCDATLLNTSSVSSIIQWAQDKGKSTGIVTTTRITHATPASMYAHTQDRNWECDSEIPSQYQNCVKDIARQLIEDEPGRSLKVILGGGLQQLGVEVSDSESSCKRSDGRNLTAEWMADKEGQGFTASFARTTEQLMAMKASSNHYVMGLFGYGHTPYEAERDKSSEGTPSLVNMTTKAIELLRDNPNGFVLLVEGGRIDHGHHANYARMSLTEAITLDLAVAAALEYTSRDDTLIVVTADHSHSMTMNGYPKRGNDILGFAHDDTNKPKYETLTYANGPGFSDHRKEGEIGGTEYLWKDVEAMDRTQNRYRHFAPIAEPDETHGGEDVAVYATGPFAHLFTGVHEQSYIAHAISCAGNFGPHEGVCTSFAVQHAQLSISAISLVLLVHFYI